MNEYIEKLILKTKKDIDGKTMYDGEIIQHLNKLGVKFTFLQEGIRWNY